MSFLWVPPAVPRSLRGRPLVDDTLFRRRGKKVPSQVKGAFGVATRWRTRHPWTCEPPRPLRAALRAGRGLPSTTRGTAGAPR